MGLKAQSEMMEYILMVVFLVAAIIAIILFLSWWNIQQLQMEGSKNLDDRVVSIAQLMMNDYMLANGDSVFDDAKLTSVAAAGIKCEDLQKIYGTGWYVKIKSLDMEGERPCTWNSYPGCNTWTFCNYVEHPESRSVYNFPVNVYRKASDKMALAVLHVEVYS
jgi:hypothetical protein